MRTLPVLLSSLLWISGCGKTEEDPSSDTGLFAAGGSDSSSGTDGTDGADGADGADGTDGTDGSSGTPSDWDACSADEGHGTDLDAASIDGDTLTATVAYSGGCEDHTFTLCWDGSFLESAPVQVRLELLHTGPPDPCEAYPSETLGFDLTPLREAYGAAYGTETGVITVNLATRGGSATTTYSF